MNPAGSSLPTLTAELVEQRLRRASALANLESRRRLEAKVLMTAEAVTARLRAQSAARAACVAWGKAGVLAFSGGHPRPARH